MGWRSHVSWSLVGLAVVAVPTEAEARRVVFLNADAVAVNADNGQDPTLNSYATTGFTPGTAGGWPALTDADKDMLTFLMREASVPFDIVYTWERPVSGSYDMIVMGDADDSAALFPSLGCSGAIGLADCGDTNAENISFLFWGCLSAGDQDNLEKVAHTTFAALGFGWGLENTGANAQIMGSFLNNGTSLDFGTSCTDVSGTAVCTDHVGCPAGEQNATSDLVGRIGARVDDGMPDLAITEPADAAILSGDFAVRADVDDMFGGLTVEMTIVEAGLSQIDETPPYSWSLSDVPDGPWTVQVQVTDADGNVRAEQVSVCVTACGDSGDDAADDGDTDPAGDSTGGPDAGDSTTGEAQSESSSSDDGPVGTGVDNPTSPIDPTGLGQNVEPTSGCTCRSTPERGAWALFGLLMLPWMRRRRA